MENYIKGKGVFVGTFSVDDIINGKDKTEITKSKESTGLQYLHAEHVRKGKNIVGVKVYVCNIDDAI